MSHVTYHMSCFACFFFVLFLFFGEKVVKLVGEGLLLMGPPHLVSFAISMSSSFGYVKVNFIDLF